MSLLSFWNAMTETGRLVVPPPGGIDDDDVGEAREAVVAFEAELRRDLPGDAPPFDPAVAIWALAWCYRAAQFLAYRDAEARAVREGLAFAFPKGDAAVVAYSADVVLHVLPDLHRLAIATAREDPVIDAVRAVGRSFPLSSVGIAGIEPLDLSAVTGNFCLLGVYVDRIISRRDVGRLADPAVLAAARAAGGGYPELVGVLSMLPQPEPTPVSGEK